MLGVGDALVNGAVCPHDANQAVQHAELHFQLDAVDDCFVGGLHVEIIRVFGGEERRVE